jgi:uncharacterized protein YbjT (DUF2867 family)
MPKPITVLVSGATGRQGGAVARALLEHGHRVRALTRRPNSPTAARLAALGVDVREGDLEDATSVERAARGADAFFLLATPYEAGVEAEVRQGRNAADAAKRAGVKHLVYSSVASADRSTGIPHFESKREVEQHIVRLGLPATVVAPVFFMENLLGRGFLDALRRGALTMPLPPGRILQVVAAADMAGFVRLALERPAEFRGKRIDIASDALTGREMAAAFARATGSTIGYEEAPIAAVREKSEDLARMWEWFARNGYRADVEGLRATWPEVGWHDFSAWAREQDWSVLDAASPEQPTA